MRFRALILALAAAGGACLTSTTARAYCLARACDRADPKQHCEVDHDGCVTTGSVLRWPSSCVTFAIQRDGSPAHDLDADAVTEASVRAFGAWLGASCDGEPPSIEAGLLDPVACNESRYNPDGKNANIILFRDDEWPYPGTADTYGLTTVRFEPASGAILDADIEINGVDFPVTTTPGDGTDLQSILTHELGHFLGLDHSKHADATMSATWNGEGLALRTLTSDDEAGLCVLYPPGRRASASCIPENGFASECNAPRDPSPDGSCALADRLPPSSSGSGGGALVLAVLLGARRARSRRPADIRAAFRTREHTPSLRVRRRLGMIERWLVGG